MMTVSFLNIPVSYELKSGIIDIDLGVTFQEKINVIMLQIAVLKLGLDTMMVPFLNIPVNYIR